MKHQQIWECFPPPTIPAGFFCKGSKAFTERVAFKGLPLATEPPGELWNADTVVERLDDAVFDDRGVATTRLQFRALSLVSVAPIETACGAFHLYVSLDGKQQVTTMKIARTGEDGGSFTGPLAVDVRMKFLPVNPQGKDTPKLVFREGVRFPGVTAGLFLDKATPCHCCPGELCHADDGQQHCFYVTMCPGTYSCC